MDPKLSHRSDFEDWVLMVHELLSALMSSISPFLLSHQSERQLFFFFFNIVGP